MITGCVPVLACEDVAAASAFYQQALRFVVLRQRHDAAGVLQWVHLQNGALSLMLEKLPPEKKAADRPAGDQPPTSRLYFYVDDIDALHHFLRARGEAVSPIEETAYRMREFHCADPAGHALTLGQLMTGEGA